MNEYRLIKVHMFVNRIYETRWDNTNINSSKCIDTILASTGLIEYLDRYRLIDFNNTLFTDHREYIINIALEDYFSTSRNYVDKLKVNQLKTRKLRY